MPYAISIENAKVYKVRFKREGEERWRYGWCDAAVRSWPRGGSISIQSDYGTFAYSWNSTGTGPFVGFLRSLDFDYFMGKAKPGYMRFDHDKSISGVRAYIIEQRRDDLFQSLSKEDARECWNHLDTIEHSNSGEYFLTQLLASRELSALYDSDYSHAICNAPDPQAVGFWDEMWPALCARWEVEAAAEEKRIAETVIYPYQLEGFGARQAGNMFFSVPGDRVIARYKGTTEQEALQRFAKEHAEYVCPF